MDPNANLQSQEYLTNGPLDRHGVVRLRELRYALREWLNNGGFEPEWADYPRATAAYRSWLKWGHRQVSA